MDKDDSLKSLLADAAKEIWRKPKPKNPFLSSSSRRSVYSFLFEDRQDEVRSGYQAALGSPQETTQAFWQTMKEIQGIHSRIEDRLYQVQSLLDNHDPR